MSGSLLQTPPKKARGVRRLNSWPTWIAGGMVGVAVVATAWNYEHRTARTQRTGAQVTKDPLPSDWASLDGLIQDHSVHTVLYRPPEPSAPLPPAVQRTIEAQPAANSQPPVDLAEQTRKQAWLAYYANVAQVEQARFTAEKAALTADTALGNGQAAVDPAAAGTAVVGTPNGMPTGEPVRPAAAYPAGIPVGVPGYVPGGFGYPAAVPDISGAREKQAFMAQAGDTSGASDTLQATVRDPISPYLITAGDFINCVSVGGENSDAPGMFVGRVTQNVYDSATGRYLLIPQGAKVIGVYDNAVSQGQTRIPTAITRIIFPDSESIDLGSMPAADQSGFAGLHDQVNTHWWAKFGNALILGIAGAGAQLAQGGYGNNNNGYNAGQLATGAIAQQFAELGAETARSGLTIPNTLIVPPGYRFTIQVTKDIALRPYVDERTSGGAISLGPVMQ
jgi:type IV secretion system protein VirB10